MIDPNIALVMTIVAVVSFALGAVVMSKINGEEDE